jgi:hypothetical protein
MDNLLTDMGPAIVAILACGWWWFLAKEAASRKYIILMGICWLVCGIGYTIGRSFDISELGGALGGLIVLASIGSVYFFIKAIRSERKARNKPPDD